MVPRAALVLGKGECFLMPSPVILVSSHSQNQPKIIMYVYIMANTRPTLYTGVTNDLVSRVYQHKNDLVDGFTKKYHIYKLVYYEQVNGEIEAIVREKQIKDMNRSKKLNMIKQLNPTLNDLYPNLLDSGRNEFARMTTEESIL